MKRIRGKNGVINNDGVIDKGDGQERSNDWAIFSRAIVSALTGICSMHVHRIPMDTLPRRL
jgi:hypothetical protein